jgi:hypothetical protein
VRACVRPCRTRTTSLPASLAALARVSAWSRALGTGQEVDPAGGITRALALLESMYSARKRKKRGVSIYMCVRVLQGLQSPGQSNLLKLVYQPVPPHGLEITNNYNYLFHALIHLLHILIIVIGLVSNNFFP